MQFPDDDTGHMLQQIHDEGVDLTGFHTLDFFILFEKHEHAISYQEALKSSELSADSQLGTCPDTGVFEVKVSIKMVPQHDVIMDTEAYLESLADKHNGYGDGWGLMA